MKFLRKHLPIRKLDIIEMCLIVILAACMTAVIALAELGIK